MGTGHKNKRGKNKGGRRPRQQLKAEDLKRDIDIQIYGKVISGLGNRRFKIEVQNIVDNTKPHIEINASMAGSLKDRIEAGMYVLCEPMGSVTEFEEGTYSKGKIVSAYTAEDIGKLKRANLWDFTKEGDDEADIFERSGDAEGDDEGEEKGADSDIDSDEFSIGDI
jgi:translation initiation factor IF-1